jgi:hypothetical protein
MALSYSLAHLAVPYGGRQDARLEPKYILSSNANLRALLNAFLHIPDNISPRILTV